MPTNVTYGPEFAHQVGKFETDLRNGLEYAHQKKTLGKYETVLTNGLEFAHLIERRICPPLEYKNNGLQFAHLTVFNLPTIEYTKITVLNLPT